MVLYFTGTGNSRYIATRLSEALGDALFSMNDRIKAGDTLPVASGERLVIVTPTYAWRIPRIVRDWLAETDFPCGAQAMNNITIQNGKPVWGGDCTHCMACICRCPTEAIEYGKKSLGKPRYHFEAL
ncbi:MAG: flavodoxin domain-containing protein [Gemmiger sp.]